MGLRHLEKITSKLIEAEMPTDTPAAVIERATLLEMRVINGEFSTLPALTDAAAVRAPAVIVVGETVRVRTRLMELAVATHGGSL